MSANPIWIAGYFGPVAGAAPVWIAPGDGTVPSAVQSQVVSYYAPVAGATAVWIAGFFAPPPAAIGATPITISGWGGSGGGGAPPVTSVWSAADAAAGGMTLSNGGLTVNPNWTTGYAVIRSSISKTSGLLYAEFAVGAAPTQSSFSFGLASAGIDLHNFIGATNYGGSSCTYSIYDGASSGFTSNFQAPNVVPQTNDVVSIAVNFTTGSIWLAINNAWVGGGNPALTKNLPIISFVPATVGPLFLAFCASGSNPGVWTLQSTAASQTYAPPSGFVAWDAP